jgi:hypothetical protein
VKIVNLRVQVAADDDATWGEVADILRAAVRGIGNVDLPAKGEGTALLPRPLLFGAADIKRGPETRVKKEIKP